MLEDELSALFFVLVVELWRNRERERKGEKVVGAPLQRLNVVRVRKGFRHSKDIS